MKYGWILLRPNEDGPMVLLDQRGYDELFANPVESHGITRLLDHWPTSEDDPMYWPDGLGLLLAIRLDRGPEQSKEHGL